MQIAGLDELDNKIIELVKDNARLTYSEIGNQLGVSRVTVRERMNRLENEKIITGYHAAIAETNLPDGILFFLDIETEPEHYESLLGELCSDDTIRQVYSVSGDCSVHAVGYASNSRNLQLYVNRLRKALKGVRRISSYVAMSTIKDVNGGVDYEEIKQHRNNELQPDQNDHGEH